jgi:hypothetical protein
MPSQVVELYKSFPAKHRDQFYELVLIYAINQKSWICSNESDMDAFDQLQRALRRLKHEPFNLSTEDVETIADNHEDWMSDMMDIDKFNGKL